LAVSGGVSYAATVSATGQLSINQGIASGSVISSGGSDAIFAGGTGIGTGLTGATETVNDGGIASFSLLHAGAEQLVQTGGLAVATAVGSGGVILVSGGGKTSAASVHSGGTEIVFSGGIAAGTTVSSGGTLVVLPGGSASGVISASGAHVIDSGVVVQRPGNVYSGYGAVASGLVISAGLAELVLSGGTASHNSVEPGGVQTVYAGGKTIGTLLSGYGAYEYVSSGGVASNTTVESGDEIYVSAGGTASGSLIAQGLELIESGGVTYGDRIGANGQVFIEGGSVSGAVISGGYLVQDYGGSILGSVSFAGSGVLQISVPSGSNLLTDAVISGFGSGDVIAFGPDLTTGDTVSVKSAGIVTVSAGGLVYNLNIAGATVGETDFHVSGSLYYGVELTRSSTSGAVVKDIAAASATRMAFIAPPASASAASAGLPELASVVSGGFSVPGEFYAVTSGAHAPGAVPVLWHRALPGGVLAPLVSQSRIG
jgi:autotransporter passenger strand-loop-strand repeat protein